MFCRVLVLLFLLSSGISSSAAQIPAATPNIPAAKSPAATTAKQAFDQLQKQWVESIVLLQKKNPRKSQQRQPGA